MTSKPPGAGLHIARDARPRPLAAGLLVALGGPAFWAFPFMAVAAIGAGPMGSVIAMIVFYLYALIPAILTALVIGSRIAATGWISMRFWVWATIIISLIFPALLGAVDLTYNPRPNFVLYPVVGLLFVIPTCIASFALRVLIVRFGWMVRPMVAVVDVF